MLVNKEALDEARSAWGQGMIAISKAHEEGGIEAALPVANGFLDTLYGFEFGPVLFKPTLSSGTQTFRTNKDGALSYFLGHNPKFPFDNGFGIKSWRDIKSQTSAIFLDTNISLWMGWVTFTDKDGNSVKVDKSWGYKKTRNGTLKIILHHSSLPYNSM